MSWPEELMVRPLREADARQIAEWRYEGRWSIYDAPPDGGPASLHQDYLAVSGPDGGPLVGFCCSDREALVPGLDPHDDVLDVGVGMDPQWVGQGHGLAFARAVLEHYRSVSAAPRIRAVVQSWNQRSLRLLMSLGFEVVGEHRCEQAGRTVTYTLLVSG